MITLAGIDLEDVLLVEEAPALFEGAFERSVSGMPIIFGRPLTGRPITLKGDADGPWLSRTTLDALQALAALGVQTHTLNLDGQIRTVIFRHWDAPVLQFQRVVAWVEREPGDLFNQIEIRLWEV